MVSMRGTPPDVGPEAGNCGSGAGVGVGFTLGSGVEVVSGAGSALFDGGGGATNEEDQLDVEVWR